MKNEIIFRQLDETQRRITAVKNTMQYADTEWAKNHWSGVLAVLINKYNDLVKEANELNSGNS